MKAYCMLGHTGFPIKLDVAPEVNFGTEALERGDGRPALSQMAIVLLGPLADFTRAPAM
jgi:hypothetical protein